jgi:predicted metalloendopeptidase
MTPQTVNAYYNPGYNEIVFPAAILQPPFFNPDADDAANYGGIGAVIGHEIGHGFDDQGSRYDGDGNLNNWWSDQDRTEFEKRTGALVDQYNQLSPSSAPDVKVNGAFTLGENIGDLGGMNIAIKAYQISLGGKSISEAPEIDGLSAMQRFFLSWAQCWRRLIRPEEARLRIATDPHSPDEHRCNQIVRNLNEFYGAFQVKESDALYLRKRVRIW